MKQESTLVQILPAVLVVFLCFIGIGATTSVIPIYVNTELGLNSFIVGVVIASHYLAMLFARPSAGGTVDTKGARVALQRGFLLFLLCGVGYLWSAKANGSSVKLTVLIGARLMLGVAESLIVTGALAWALRRVGSSRAGMVMAWNGNAMYGGIAVGALLAGLLNASARLEPVAWVFILLAGISIPIVLTLQSYSQIDGMRAPFHSTLRRVAYPGLGLLLASVGYGTILGFISLFFQHNGWSSSVFAISSFGFAYVTVRILFGGLPDKYGGVRVAFWSLLIELIGQALLFLSTHEYVALIGVVLSGAGFSLVVPAFGVEVMRRVLHQNCGSAMAGYLAFFDLAFGAVIPLAGLLADKFEIRAVYMLGFLCAFAGLMIAIKMSQMRDPVLEPINS